MVTHVFPIASVFPEFFARLEKPLADNLPVFFKKCRVSTASFSQTGEFRFALPADIETKVSGRYRLSFLPLFEQLNRDSNPAKIKLRLTGIRINVSR